MKKYEECVLPSIQCTDKPDCMTAEVSTVTLEDEHLGILKELVICRRPSTEAGVHK